MQPHQQRVVVEASDLNEKLVKLTAFLDTPLFRSLDPAEQGRLTDQHIHMTGYLRVLRERIANFA